MKKVFDKRREELFNKLLEGLDISFKRPTNEEAPAKVDKKDIEDTVKAAAQSPNPDAALKMIDDLTAKGLGSPLTAKSLDNLETALSTTRDTAAKVDAIVAAIKSAKRDGEEKADEPEQEKPSEEEPSEEEPTVLKVKLGIRKAGPDTLGGRLKAAGIPDAEIANFIRVIATDLVKTKIAVMEVKEGRRSSGRSTRRGQTKKGAKIISKSKTSAGKTLEKLLSKTPAFVQSLTRVRNRAEFEEVVFIMANAAAKNLTDPNDIITGARNVMMKLAKDRTDKAASGGNVTGNAKAGVMRVSTALDQISDPSQRKQAKDILNTFISGDELLKKSVASKQLKLAENKKRKVVIRYGKPKKEKK